MKLQPDRLDISAITGYGHGWIGLGAEKISHSLVLGSRGERLNWTCHRFEDLTASDFEPLAELQPELVLFGSGPVLRWPHPTCLVPLAHRRIGIEVMDTMAACRTYNILAGEGRHVLVALLMENP